MFFVVRVFFAKVSGQQSHSVQMYTDEVQARKRFYNILAADIDNDQYSYEQVHLLDENGTSVMFQVFDNRNVEE